MDAALPAEIRDELRLGAAFTAGLFLAGLSRHIDHRLGWAAAALLVTALAWGTRPVFSTAIGVVLELFGDFSLREPRLELHLDVTHCWTLAAAVGLALCAGRAGRRPAAGVAAAVEPEPYPEAWDENMAPPSPRSREATVR